jgi:hypothetical protein
MHDSRYPRWTYFPLNDPPPDWVHALMAAVALSRDQIDSSVSDGLTSDAVLAALRPHLLALGFEVESGKKAEQKIRRPVLFGEEGRQVVSYEVDGVHDDLGIVLEVEAGRGARGNAVYRDLVRTSLIVGADFLALGVMNAYRHSSGGKPQLVRSYDEARKQVEAIYLSGRLGLPFRGLLLFGY